MKTNKQIIFVFIIGLFLILQKPVLAQNLKDQNNILRTRISKETIEKGYNFIFNQDDFQLTIPPQTLDPTKKYKLTIKKAVWNKKLKNKVTPVYTYDLRSYQAVNLNKPIWLTIKIQKSKINNRKLKLKYWDNNYQVWKTLPSEYDAESNLIRAATHLPYAQIAVFARKNKKYKYQTGIASWYDWYGAASNDYPIGTRLKVTNLDNHKSVKVKVVSRGPFNNYIIDLPRNAFAKLADLDTGLIKVRIRPL